MVETHHILSDCEETTRRFGRCMAEACAPGDVLLLRGGLGCGKTAFVRGFAEGAGLPDPREVASPTFAIHHSYCGGRLAIHHLDLYRIEDPGQLAVQGILDPLEDGDAVVLIEWSERLAGEPPRTAAVLEFRMPSLARPGEREIAVEVRDGPSRERLIERLRSWTGGSEG